LRRSRREIPFSSPSHPGPSSWPAAYY